jgi:hypothetical protein
LAATINNRAKVMLRWYVTRLTNAVMEGLNSLIQIAKRKALGYALYRAFITMAYLIAGKLDLRHHPPHIASPGATHTSRNKGEKIISCGDADQCGQWGAGCISAWAPAGPDSHHEAQGIAGGDLALAAASTQARIDRLSGPVMVRRVPPTRLAVRISTGGVPDALPARALTMLRSQFDADVGVCQVAGQLGVHPGASSGPSSVTSAPPPQEVHLEAKACGSSRTSGQLRLLGRRT